MLEVVTPATNLDLVTVAMVNGYGADSDVIAMSVSAASRMVCHWCKREFSQQSYKERLEAPERIKVVLSESPIVSVSAADNDGESISDYDIMSSSGMLLRTDDIPWAGPVTYGGPLGASPLIYDRAPKLVIEYIAGYISQANTGDSISGSVVLPKDLERAVIDLAEQLLLMSLGEASGQANLVKVGRFTTEYGIRDVLNSVASGFWAEIVGEVDFTMMPLNVRRALMPYRRMLA